MTANIIIIRPLNLLIILVTMYIFKLGLINLFIQNPALYNFNYFLFVSATILITAAGYIINDIYDVKTDSVNDKKLIIGKNISKKSAFITNLKREIIKDVIDINGDRSIDANTLPIKLGVKSTKKIIIFLNTVLILIISFWQYFQYSVNKTFFDLSSFGEDINQRVIWGPDSFSIFYVL